MKTGPEMNDDVQNRTAFPHKRSQRLLSLPSRYTDPLLFARMAFFIGPLGEEIELFCEQAWSKER